MSVGLRSEKFNIVSNDQERKQKCDFFVSVGKTNFTDHHTNDAISGFRDAVLVCKMHDCYCTIDKNFEHLFPFLLIRPSRQATQAIAMFRLTENKPLKNVFSTTYTYSNCIVYAVLNTFLSGLFSFSLNIAIDCRLRLFMRRSDEKEWK